MKLCFFLRSLLFANSFFLSISEKCSYTRDCSCFDPAFSARAVYYYIINTEIFFSIITCRDYDEFFLGDLLTCFQEKAGYDACQLPSLRDMNQTEEMELFEKCRDVFDAAWFVAEPFFTGNNRVPRSLLEGLPSAVGASDGDLGLARDERSEESYSSSSKNSYSDSYKKSDSDWRKESRSDSHKKSDHDSYEKSRSNSYKKSDHDSYDKSRSNSYKKSDHDSYDKSHSDSYKKSDHDSYDKSRSNSYKKSDYDSSKKSHSKGSDSHKKSHSEGSDSDSHGKSYKESDHDSYKKADHHSSEQSHSHSSSHGNPNNCHDPYKERERHSQYKYIHKYVSFLTPTSLNL